ncbi:alpha/beta hydrolase [Pricia sp.]|uniref:alpha/beta hydrolase n=1 Tax=Pricia sp. TaxID=2268138 RepID=UPI00359467E9
MGIMIPCEGNSIPARIYTPDTGKDSYPVIVYYHGGGWVIAGIDAYNASTEALAQKTEAIVVSVGYRQAPEFKFPTAHNDSYAAYEWVLKNADTFKGDSARIAVVGESAGGNLAATVSLTAKQRNVRLPLHQALIYPLADNDFTTPSYLEHQNSLFLNSPLMMWFFNHYLNNPEEGDDPRISLVDADLGGMPPTTIIGAEIDPLRSEGQLLAQNLEAAGVATTYQLYTGVAHEFFGMSAILAEAEQAQALVARELKKAFGTE